jgi:putative effector of murein hydrolase
VYVNIKNKIIRQKKIFFLGKFSPFVQNTTAICSVLTIMAISYERYVAICQPLKVKTEERIC